jgi:polyhydroxyalkanoate synthesis regulator phasin
MEHWFAQMAKRRTTPQRLPDAVREAVERTLQTTLGGAQQTRGRAQEALDDVVHGAEVGAKNVRARVREAIETTRPATSDDIRELREEIAALAKRVEQLEGTGDGGRGRRASGAAAKKKPAARSAASRSSAKKPAAPKRTSARSAPGRKGSSRAPKS